ncbi:hypothetical protein PV04_03918 [Phialophora macrospora]|uniref:Transcription factor domain-containing protein n=1 Tax=Phialophora macrospora TaxID=1851006 RepID=A0A0D2G7Q0_9EURO|nr:hypothetical protein PV04_03918 [Phialophora macrospora]
MKPREVVFVEGLSWTKADKKIQISKVRAHARIIGLRTLELRRKSDPAVKCVRRRRKQAALSSPGQERPLRPLARAAEMQPEGVKSKPKNKLSLVILSPPTKNSRGTSEDAQFDPETNAKVQRPASPVEFLFDPGLYLRRSGKDAFCTRIIPPNPCLDALDFYTRYYVPNNVALYEIFNVTDIYTTFFLDLLQHPLFLHAGLANVLHELEFMLNPGGNPSQRLYMHLGTALANLRCEIESREYLLDDISIATVINLAVVARQLGDKEAHNLHKEHLRRMVDARGGLDALDSSGLHKCMILQWEGYWCWAAGQGPTIFADARPNPKADECPRRPFSETTRKLLSRLPVGFQDLAERDLLTLPTLEVLVRLAKEVNDKKNNIPVVADREVRYKQRRYHDIMQACPSLAAPPDAPTLEKLVVMALILYCSATFCIRRLPSRHSTLTVLSATKALSKTPMPASKAEMKALIWVYMVVIDAWRSRGGHLRSPGLDLVRLFKAQFPDLEDWADIEDVLQKFFWTEDMGRFVGASWDLA